MNRLPHLFRLQAALDALCAQLWGVDAAGLRAIQSAYRDLYVTAPQPTTGDAQEAGE